MSAIGNVVLRRLFPHSDQLQSLESFFDRLPRTDPNWSLHRDSDTDAFRGFVRDTLIAQPTPTSTSTQLPAVGSEPMCSQHDVLLRVLGLLHRRGEVGEKNGVPGNCLAAGYRPTREQSSAGLRGLEQLEMYTFTPSTHVLKKPMWRELLARVGDEPMTFALLNCRLFVPLPNRCYLQLTGAPIRPHLMPADSRVLPPFQANRSVVVKRLLASSSSVVARKAPRLVDVATPPSTDAKKHRLSAWRRRKVRRERTRAEAKAVTLVATVAPVVPVAPVAPTSEQPPQQASRAVPTYWQAKLRDELSEYVCRTQIFYNSNSLLQNGRARFHPQHVFNQLTAAVPTSAEEWRRRACVLAYHIFCDSSKSVATLLSADKTPPLPKHLRGVVSHLQAMLQKFVQCNVSLLLRVHCPIQLAATPRAEEVAAVATETEVFEATTASGATPRAPLKRRRHHRSGAASQFGGGVATQLVSQLSASTTTTTPKRVRVDALASAVGDTDDVDLDDYAYFVLDIDAVAGEPHDQTVAATPSVNPIVWPALDQEREHRRRREQALRERQELYHALNAAPLATLLGSHSSFHNVTRFLHACLDRLLPLALLGDAHNRRVFYAHLAKFVRMRRFEKLSTRELTDGLSTDAFRYLSASDDAHDPQMLLRRQYTVARLVRWLVDHVVVPIVAGSFYVTESHEHRNQTFYYRRPVWARVVAQWRDGQLGAVRADGDDDVDVARKVAFEPVAYDDAVRVMKRRHFAYAYARLLPKRGGRVRTIMNLGRRPSLYEQALCEMRAGFAASINSTLAAAHRVLQFETQTTPDVLGATVFKWDDIYRRMLQFARQWRALGSPPLFACSIDVKNSFDSIEQAPLLDVVLGLLRQEQYYVQRWQSVGPNPHSGHLALRFHRGVPPAHVPPHDVLASAAVRAASLRHAIVADLPPPRVVTRSELHEQLREHIQNNLIKDGGRFYRQRIGIPQGSVLSSLMCCAVYAYVERHCLAPLGLANANADGAVAAGGAPYAGTLLRLIDDFLYITTKLDAAVAFARALLSGFAEYGCTANAQKLQLNFTVPGVGSEPRSLLPWCGFLLDTETLELRCDYTRFFDAHMNESLTVELAQHAGWSLERKVKHVLKMRLHPLLVDEQLVSSATACRNIFEAAMLAALKFHAHARALQRHNAAFELGVVVGAAEYAATLMREMSASGVARELEMRSSVRGSHVEYVVLRAFELVMERKPARYAQVLAALVQRMRAAAMRRAAKAMREVVAGASAAHELLARCK